MGNSLSSIVYSFLQYLGLYSREVTILVIGLDNAGKTTLMYRFLHNKLIQMAPSLHVNEDLFTHGGVTIKAYDVGGQESLRILWKRFLCDADAILYLVDSADSDRFEEVKHELGEFNKMEKGDVPFALLLNKSDLPQTRFTVEEICDKIGAKEVLENHSPSSVFQTSVLNRSSIVPVFDWLVSVL